MENATTPGMEPIEARIAELRRKVEMLLEQQVNPAVSQAADRAQHLAGQVSATSRREVESVSAWVREKPLMALGCAAAAGYLLARLTGR